MGISIGKNILFGKKGNGIFQLIDFDLAEDRSKLTLINQYNDQVNIIHRFENLLACLTYSAKNAKEPRLNQEAIEGINKKLIEQSGINQFFLTTEDVIKKNPKEYYRQLRGE